MEKENLDKLQQIEDMYASVHQSIIERALSKRVVHSCIVHLPIRNVNKGWSEEIYDLSDKFLKELYQYSHDMGYIEESVTFEQFIKQ